MGPSVYMIDPATEPQILVDLETREVTVPKALYNIGVTDDNNAETVYFKVSDTFDGNPLDDKQIKVWFTNAKKEPYSTTITDIKHENGSLIIGWTIDERLTRYHGTIQFQIQFYANGYKLNTLPAELNILKGLDLYSSAPELENNVYEQIIIRLSDLEQRLLALENKIIEIDDLSYQLKLHEGSMTQIKNEVTYLKNNVVYIPT